MIIPIFIPIQDDHDDDDKHHHGCMCPDCVNRKKWDSMPREYYEERYAVPRKWYYKNQIIKALRIIFILMGILIAMSSLFLNLKFVYFPLLFLVAVVFIIFTFIIFDKYIKQDYQCKEKIRLEKKSWFNNKTWNDIIKEANLPQNYVIGEIRESWRFK